MSRHNRIQVINDAVAKTDDKAFVLKVEEHFRDQGETIYKARNEIKVIGKYNVKKFGIPNLFNRYIYDRLRPSKAERAYRNAFRLIALGIPTPVPFGFVLHKEGGALLESYLITEQLLLKRSMYEFGHVSRQKDAEEALKAFGHFTARLHERGVLHLDYSPGNILFDEKEDGGYTFAIVDVNRLRFSKEAIPIDEGLRNMRRLWGEKDEIALIARTYAEARGAKADRAERMLLGAHAGFWRKRDTRWIHD